MRGNTATAGGGSCNQRVCFALPDLLPFGGVESMRMTMIEYFLREGFAVDLILVNEPSADLAKVVPNGVRIFEFSVPRMRYFISPLVAYLRKEKPDVLFADMWSFTSVCILANYLAVSGTRVVVCDHNPLSRQYAKCGLAHRALLRTSMALTYPLADVRIAVSVGVADDLSRLSKMARDRFTVIHNPMSLKVDNNEEGEINDKVWAGWKGRRIITVGRFKEQKNHDLLIRSFKRLLETTDAQLMILGTGELEKQTQALVLLEGLKGKVIMPGHVSNPVPFYRSADLFVLSSDYEGFGNVIVEALACGLPVVSTDCPSGPAEILENGRYGTLVPVGDENALAKAMSAALKKEHDTEALKRRAADFAPEIAAEKYLDLLFPDRKTKEKILASGKARSDIVSR